MTLPGYVAVAVAGGLGAYFAVGLAFHFLYYRRRRDTPDAWKCQPRRFASDKLRRRDLVLGTANLTVASILSGVLAHAIATDNPTRVYTTGHSLLFGVAVTLVYFVLTDFLLYAAHRTFHRPALFKAFHLVHHRNTTPTAFTAMAMHPLEFAVYQGAMLVPLFLLPIPVVGLVIVLVYQNFIALLDHSGVDLRSRLPWQPPPRFHDDHHRYFHVNYGQTLGLWDRLFGTWRREGRRYGADVFGGRGAPAEGRDRLVDYQKETPR
jgi:lathosterol oxidase